MENSTNTEGFGNVMEKFLTHDALNRRSFDIGLDPYQPPANNYTSYNTSFHRSKVDPTDFPRGHNGINSLEKKLDSLQNEVKRLTARLDAQTITQQEVIKHLKVKVEMLELRDSSSNMKDGTREDRGETLYERVRNKRYQAERAEYAYDHGGHV